MPLTEAPPLLRRLAPFAPFLIIAVLFGAPLLIWAVKTDPSPIQTVKVPGRILSIEDLPGPGGRVTVGLDDGSTATVEPKHLPQELEQGDNVVLLKKTGEDGAVTMELEPPAK